MIVPMTGETAMSKADGRWVLLAVLPAVCAGSALAQSDAQLQRALDRRVAIDVADAPIPEVFRRLTKTTGVEFLIGEEVYAALPYGDQTRLSVKLRNVTLRKALSPMLAPQAMEWTVERGGVRIVPAPALMRMGRRATYDELVVLGKIHSERMLPTEKAGSVVEQLRKATGRQELNLFFHVKADQPAALKRAERQLPCAAAAWLDMLCHGQGWTWYLWGDDIMIVDKKAQVQRQLQQQVTLRYESAELIAVLLDLARMARVQLTMDPGVMDLVPEQTQKNFNLVMAKATIAQALEVISGATGLKFSTHAEGIRAEASEALTKRAPGAADAAQRKVPFFIKRSVRLADGSTVELLIRPEDLPKEVVEAIEAERARLMQLIAQKFRPTTRPATTQPSK